MLLALTDDSVSVSLAADATALDFDALLDAALAEDEWLSAIELRVALLDLEVDDLCAVEDDKWCLAVVVLALCDDLAADECAEETATEADELVA